MEESKLRTAMMYFIFGRYFIGDVGMPWERELNCRLQDMGLVSTKALWNAKDEQLWRAEYDTYSGSMSVKLKYGDLLHYTE